MKTAPQLWMLRTAFRTVGSLAPEVAARWAEAIFCRPPWHDPRPAEEAFLATGWRSTLRSQGEDLAVWWWGRGPAVVLAHGWGSHGLVGHSLGGAAVSLAMHQGLKSSRAVLLAPPADVFLFSHAFVEHLRIPPRARDVMRQNLETRTILRDREVVRRTVEFLQEGLGG